MQRVFPSEQCFDKELQGTRFVPMITVFTKEYQVVLPLKMGNHLFFPIRQME